MEYRNLEITVISAKDLGDINLFSKMDVYSYVSISSDPKSKQKTPADHEGGKNPTWNYTAKFQIDEAAAKQNQMTVVFQLKDQQILGDKEIGEVQVPVKELLESVDKPTQFVSYQVRKPSGRAKGQLNISYKFGEKIMNAPTAPMPTYTAPVPEPYKVNNEPMTAYYPAQAAVGSSSSGYPQSSCMPYPPPENAPYPPPPQAVGGYPPPPGAEYGYPSQPPPPQYEVYPPPPQPVYGGYPPPQPGYGYPPAPQQPGYGYPPPQQPGYGYPPQQPGYGYPPQQPGYGYPPGQQPYGMENKKKKKNETGLGFGAGLLGGAIGGMLIGDMVSDATDF